MPGLPECRRLLAIPIEVDGHLGLRAVAFERVDVEIGDRPRLPAAGRRKDAVVGKAVVHRRVDRGLAGIRIQSRTPVGGPGGYRLRDEHPVLQCARHAADAHPGRARLRVRTARHQQQTGAGFALGAHGQGEFAVVTDSDAGAHARHVEDLEFVAALDDASVPLESGQLQLVLIAARAVRGEPPRAVAIASRGDFGQERAGLDDQAQLARQVGVQRQPLGLQRLQRGQRSVQVAADFGRER